MSGNDVAGPVESNRRGRRRWSLWLPVALLVAVAALALRTGRLCPVCWLSRSTAGGVTVDLASENSLRPMVIVDPAHLRWWDAADAPYSDQFREQFTYEHAQVRVEYQPRAETLRGRVMARGLKPWFAYQLKLVGAAPVRGVRAADNPDVMSWSSWQLGRLGRWWCADCAWNVADAELSQHLREGHQVRGYVLFDWFVTDAVGQAEH